jgi:hypothetical protein
MTFKQRYQRIRRYEFWPFWLFYLPFVPLWLWYSLRSGSLLYFSRTNPKMRFGGFMQYSKYKSLENIESQYVPRTLYFKEKPADVHFYSTLFNFPFIAKPDFGERGKNVELIRNAEDWHHYFNEKQGAFMLQEYVDFKHELGVLYYRFPSGKSGITSVVEKGFLTIIGDGDLTFKQLISQHLRAAKRMAHFEQKFGDRLNETIPKGKELVLEEIGNHCRGTAFIDANHLINAKLVHVFDQIVAPVDGFHYGRFDLKVASIEDLYQGTNIQIFELNGVNSEAAHIYDPNGSLLLAYRDVYRNLKIVFKIGLENRKQGFKTPRLSEFILALNKQLRV